MTKRNSMTKRELVKEISDRTELKTEVVMSVINCFIDIFIREVIVNEIFTLANCFTVKSKKRKPRKGKSLETGEEVTYPETRVLSMKLSRKINYFFRWKIRNERNVELGMTPETWHEIYEEKTQNEAED